jgi:alpha-mannosidase
MKQSEDGSELVVRLVEIFGQEANVNLKIPVQAGAVRRLNLVEMPLENSIDPVFNGRTIQVKIKPHEILTLGITPI